MAITNAVARISKERFEWRRNHPIGFVARPSKNEDGSLNLMIWDCVIPGLKNTIWEDGLYSLKMIFKDSYPATPPKCRFIPPIYHPNVYPSGIVSLSILNEDVGWRPSMSIVDILKGIQYLLDKPNIEDLDNLDALNVYRSNRELYNRRVLQRIQEMREL